MSGVIDVGVTVMETVNRALGAVSRYIWGAGGSKQQREQHGEEPLSGVTGKGTGTDPYDAGNRDGMLCPFVLDPWQIDAVLIAIPSPTIYAIYRIIIAFLRFCFPI